MSDSRSLRQLRDDLSACTLCTERFSKTATAHKPRPIVWFEPGAKIVVAGQAPGARVHKSGLPFDDPSGDRLREWMGVSKETFYDKKQVAILPMAFCFPGYNAKGSDLPPPKICARTWREGVMREVGDAPLLLLAGGYAQQWHLEGKSTVRARVEEWRLHAPRVFPLPHPSWRNTGWLKKHPWFERELVPALQAQVTKVLAS